MTADQAKATADAMAALWEGEFAATANVLAAVKDDNRDYKPDAKSRTAWELATHLATADIWFMDSIIGGRFAFDQEKANAAIASFAGAAEVAAFYRRAFPEKLAALRAIPAEQMTDSIDFFSVMKKTRAEWIGFANNHSVHHRGQLAAYLRAMGSKVPDIYGPSADSKPES